MQNPIPFHENDKIHFAVVNCRRSNNNSIKISFHNTEKWRGFCNRHEVAAVLPMNRKFSLPLINSIGSVSSDICVSGRESIAHTMLVRCACVLNANELMIFVRVRRRA